MKKIRAKLGIGDWGLANPHPQSPIPNIEFL